MVNMAATARDHRAGALDDRTRALIRIAALVATGGGPSSYEREVAGALAAGATAGDVVGTLVAVAPTVGMAHVVSAAAGLALGLGYDVDRALEGVDEP
jgi:alkylhydroperoxidase/carboxymuconolactone decarboxylase family protein YurZ